VSRLERGKGLKSRGENVGEILKTHHILEPKKLICMNVSEEAFISKATTTKKNE
jgi:hypothetical protein